MSTHKNLSNLPLFYFLLIACFIVFTCLSWVIVFRDPRALIGIGNLYPSLKPLLFPTQAMLSHFGLNSLPTIVFALTAFVAIFCYGKSLISAISLTRTILGATVFLVITFFSFPVLSTDIFSYIFSERVATIHHQNIWQVKPAAFPDDQFGVLADWKDTTSVYGGVHYLLYFIPSLIGQNDLLTLVVLYKVVPLFFVFGSLYVFYLLLRSEKKEILERGIRLVFWNPLFVLEIAGSAHNDSMMLFFMLLSIYFYRKKLWLLSGIILALAVQVKLIPLILFIFLFLHLLRKKALLSSEMFLAGFLSVNALIFSFMQVSVISFLQRVAYNGGVYWQSLSTVSQTFFPVGVKVILFGFLAWTIIYTLLQVKKKINPIESYVTVILVYLIFVSSAYWNWYVLWLLPLIPFALRRNLLFTILMLTFTSLLAYPLLWVIYRINNPSPMWQIVTYLFIFGPPIITYILCTVRIRWVKSLISRLKLDILFAEKAYNWV